MVVISRTKKTQVGPPGPTHHLTIGGGRQATAETGSMIAEPDLGIGKLKIFFTCAFSSLALYFVLQPMWICVLVGMTEWIL